MKEQIQETIKSNNNEIILPRSFLVDLERIQNTFTSKRYCFEIREENKRDISILEFLKENLSHIEKSSWEKRFLLGGVFVNGEPVLDINFILTTPAKIEYYEPKFDIDNPQNFFPEFKKENIIYDENGIVVYYKPRKLPTTPSKEQRLFNLRTYLENYYNTSVHLPSRLDTSTQGLVIGSRDTATHAFVQKLFEQKKIQKYYMLEVEGKTPFLEYDCHFLIKKSERHPVLREASLSEGKEARTIFKVLKYNVEKNTTLLIAKPVTGRTHQIRVHSASLGFSIIGDNFYSGKKDKELHLACVKLEFENQEGKNVTVKVKDELSSYWMKDGLEVFQ